MKKLFICFVILNGFIFFVSCEKNEDKDSSVNGQVIDYYNNQGISNLPLILFEDTIALFYINGATIDTIFTESDGSFYYEYLDKINHSYTIQSLRTNNYVKSDIVNLYPGNNNIQLKAKPFKSLQINLINESKIYDKINMKLYYFINGTLYTRNPLYKNIIDLYSNDTSIITKNVPEADHKLKITCYSSNGQIESINKEFYYYFAVSDSNIINITF